MFLVILLSFQDIYKSIIHFQIINFSKYLNIGISLNIPFNEISIMNYKTSNTNYELTPII